MHKQSTPLFQSRRILIPWVYMAVEKPNTSIHLLIYCLVNMAMRNKCLGMNVFYVGFGALFISFVLCLDISSAQCLGGFFFQYELIHLLRFKYNWYGFLGVAFSFKSLSIIVICKHIQQRLNVHETLRFRREELHFSFRIQPI